MDGWLIFSRLTEIGCQQSWLSSSGVTTRLITDNLVVCFSESWRQWAAGYFAACNYGSVKDDGGVQVARSTSCNSDLEIGLSCAQSVKNLFDQKWLRFWVILHYFIQCFRTELTGLDLSPAHCICAVSEVFHMINGNTMSTFLGATPQTKSGDQVLCVCVL